MYAKGVFRFSFLYMGSEVSWLVASLVGWKTPLICRIRSICVVVQLMIAHPAQSKLSRRCDIVGLPGTGQVNRAPMHFHCAH